MTDDRPTAPDDFRGVADAIRADVRAQARSFKLWFLALLVPHTILVVTLIKLFGEP